MAERVPTFVRCYCTGVTRQQVLHAIAMGCRTVEEVRAATGACSGCRTCHPEVEQLLAEQAQAHPAPIPAAQRTPPP